MHSVSLAHLWKTTFDFLSRLEHGSSHLAAYTGANSVITRACSPQAHDILGLATYHLRDDLLP